MEERDFWGEIKFSSISTLFQEIWDLIDIEGIYKLKETFYFETHGKGRFQYWLKIWMLCISRPLEKYPYRQSTPRGPGQELDSLLGFTWIPQTNILDESFYFLWCKQILTCSGLRSDLPGQTAPWSYEPEKEKKNEQSIILYSWHRHPTWPMKSMKPSPDLGTPCSGQSVNQSEVSILKFIHRWPIRGQDYPWQPIRGQY